MIKTRPPPPRPWRFGLPYPFAGRVGLDDDGESVLTTAATARSTVVSPGFYRPVPDEQKAYDRLYHQVLVDPRTTSSTRSAETPVAQ
nr:hypothetical protein OG999_05430 [Streptomyces sp. NBC_00886]